jgi:hypothetical protein
VYRLINLFSVNLRLFWSLDTQANLLTLYLHNDDFYMIVDGDAFSKLPCQNQHFQSLIGVKQMTRPSSYEGRQHLYDCLSGFARII